MSRAAEHRVGEGEGKGGRPLAQCPALSLPTAAPLPAYGRSAVRKGGSAQGYPRPCPCVLPASARLRPRSRPLVCRITVRKGGSAQDNPRRSPCALPASARLRPNHCVQRRSAQGKGGRPLAQCPVLSPPKTEPLPAYGRITVRKGGSAQGNPRSCPCVLPASARLRPRPRPLMGEAPSAGWGRAKAKADAPSRSNPPLPVRSPRPCLPTAPPPPPKWAPRLRRREGKRPNGAPPHHNAHTPNAARKRYLHNSRTMTQRRTKRCAQFVFFVFTPCKLLHNFSTVLHRSPRNVPKRAQIAARRPDFPCFTARFSPLSPESHCAKHPRTAPVLPPKNAPLRAYAKPRPHPRVRGTRQHATTCAFFTFSARYGRIGSPPKTNFCPAEGRKWGRLWSQMLKNGLQTKKSTFSFGRLVI